MLHLPVLGVRVRPHAAKTEIVLRASATTIRVAVRLATSVSSPIRAAVRLTKTRVSHAALLAAVIVSTTVEIGSAAAKVEPRSVRLTMTGETTSVSETSITDASPVGTLWSPMFAAMATYAICHAAAACVVVLEPNAWQAAALPFARVKTALQDPSEPRVRRRMGWILDVEMD